MDAATVYNDNPAAQARAFQDAGFEYLHIVDLNGAIDGRPVNEESVRQILAAVDMPVQLGGGIRTLDHVRTWLDAGVTRVILGTVAVKNPELVMEACGRYPGRVVIGLDARKDMVAVEGWVEDSETTIFDMADRFEEAGAAAIIYTDITRDGTGKGVNLDLTKKLAEHSSLPVIASGGVGSVSDVRAVKLLETSGVEGVIVGRALYDGSVSAADILEISQC